MGKVPGPIARVQEVVDAVVGFLLGETVLTEEVDDVVVDAHGLLFVVGKNVVLPVWF